MFLIKLKQLQFKVLHWLLVELKDKTENKEFKFEISENMK